MDLSRHTGVVLPSGREGKLLIIEPSDQRRGAAAEPQDVGDFEDQSMRVDVRVDGGEPLSEQDIFALACRVINMSAKQRRSRGCREPFKHLRTAGEICKLLALTERVEGGLG